MLLARSMPTQQGSPVCTVHRSRLGYKEDSILHDYFNAGRWGNPCCVHGGCGLTMSLSFVTGLAVLQCTCGAGCTLNLLVVRITS